VDQIGSGLFRLLFKFDVITIKDNEYAVVIFAIACSLIGVLTVVADLSFFLIRGESLLNLRHSFRNTILFAFAWALGALIIGYIGQVTNVFQVSLLACATVGISWPIVFTKILEKLERKEEVQSPSQEDVV
jgi:hypothetical protein